MPDFTKPIRLADNNFTPLTRTPWAGDKIARNFKNFPKDFDSQRIGESWEVSCDPAFPSLCIDYNCTLQDIISEYPVEMLGNRKSEDATCEILLKIIDTSAPLSLQIHPDDNDPDLATSECGKPESWYVLDAEKGAGIYLGFNQPMEPSDLIKSIASGKARSVLQFIEVKPGDYFEIAPGVPHAIGAGVTILEPQRILKGKSGKTFRMWDWDRTYDTSGNEDPAGEPRELHLDQSLKLIDFSVAHGPAYIESLRRTPNIETTSSMVTVKKFPANPFYKLTILNGHKDSVLNIQTSSSFKLILSLNPKFKIREEDYPKGQALFLPAKTKDCTLHWLDTGSIAVLEPAMAFSASAMTDGNHKKV